MNKVWVLGDAVVDVIPNAQGQEVKYAGGAPANVAVAIARLGNCAAFIGRVGDDEHGHFMQETLNRERVDTRYMRLDNEQRTSTVKVELNNGERSFRFTVIPSADQFLTPQDLPQFRAKQWLHCCSIALAREPSRSTTLTAIKNIKQQGGFVCFDPNLREEVWENPEEIRGVIMATLGYADVVKFSDDELLWLTQTDSIEAGMSVIRDLKLPLVIITQGAKGALVYIQGESQGSFAGKPVQPIDTTGAGDAFVGGLLAALASTDDWLSKKCIIDAVQQANTCGRLTTTQMGAMSALPTYEQLQQDQT